MFSEKMMDHCQNPRNVGKLDENDKNVGTGHVLPNNCYTTNTVTINSKKLKKADLEISVKKNGTFSSNAKATLKVNY